MKCLVLLVSFIGGLISASRYASAADCDVSLPQNSSPQCKAMRNAALSNNKKTWTLKYDPALYGFARLNMTPAELAPIVFKDPFTRYYTTMYTQTLKINEKVLEEYINQTFGQAMEDFSDYLKMSAFFQSALEPLVGECARQPSKSEAFINKKTEWINDKSFTQQRLAGTNPLSIQRVTIHRQGKEEKEEGTIGFDWNKLKETLNPNFDWEDAVQKAMKTDDCLEDVINQGRIYALRYELCDNLPRSPDLTGRDPRRRMWNFLSPIALFASAKGARRNRNKRVPVAIQMDYKPGARGRRNKLVPVAIQMDYKPDSDVYTPEDGDNWMIAKLNVQITDIGYAQIVEHLGRIHFMIEPFCVILKRTLSYQHPLNQILKYHCRELVVPNTFGVPNLLGESKFTDLLFAYGNDGAYRLLQDTYPLTTWEVTDYRGNIKKRGLDDRKLLPYFPFRDDGLQILKVIEDMVEKYVNLYYKENTDVQEDEELQAYLNELSLSGTGPNGGIGRIQEFPASICTKEELCHILSRFLSHVTIYHASVNYVVTDYPEYIPNQPTKLYNDSRVGDGEFSIYRLPNRLSSAVQSSAFNTLGVFRLDSLFDYGNELQDNNAVNLINGYFSFLMNVVQPRMQKKNQRRKKSGDLTYPYFIPKWLPNGIQT